MKNHILPVLRHKLVADITVQDICEVLDPLWEKKTTIASRIRGQLEAIFTLAKREGVYIGENPATWKGNLEAYFPPPARVHRRGLHHRGARRSAEGESSCRQARAQCFRLRRPHRHATS
jgi:hypothetical protein